MSTLSARSEDYLKTIYKLQSERKVVRVKDLAVTLGVRSPTVVGVISGLKDSGLVDQEHYGYISLTGAGEKLARTLVQNEELLKSFFREILDLGPDEAEANACSIEHYITPTCRERLVAFIRFLEVCGKGSPKWLDHFRHFLHTGEPPPCDRCGEMLPGEEKKCTKE
ncbi:MAG: metal-dependent transcriptional regulator [Thermovirgaceae bacterium]|nr:metal-dependent transcriptional regulator [Thermovirgaceae bacterium]